MFLVEAGVLLKLPICLRVIKYAEDPFGLIFEVYSHSYELAYSQGAY